MRRSRAWGKVGARWWRARMPSETIRPSSRIRRKVVPLALAARGGHVVAEG